MNHTMIKTTGRKLQEGKAGYVLAWLLGVPLPILALFWLFFDR